MPIDPSILGPAGQIFYNEGLTTDEVRERLMDLLERRPELEGEVAGYMESLAMIDDADEPIDENDMVDVEEEVAAEDDADRQAPGAAGEMDPVDADAVVREAWRALADATRTSFERVVTNPLPLDGTAVTEAVLLRMRAFYEAEYATKDLLDRRVATPGAAVFADAILFFVKATLDVSSPGVEVSSERAVVQKRGAMKPDITVWRGSDCVAFVECKTQLGWARERWAADFEARELRIQEHHLDASGFLVVMTSQGWGGFGDDPRVGKQLFVLSEKWPDPPGFIERQELRSGIVTHLEGLLQQLIELAATG